MAKINDSQKEKMLILIKQMTIANKTIQNIRDEIHRVLGVSYCLKSVLNYRTLAFNEEYIQKLREDNDLMIRWLKEAEIEKQDLTHERYAERLYLASKGSLTMEELEDCL